MQSGRERQIQREGASFSSQAQLSSTSQPPFFFNAIAPYTMQGGNKSTKETAHTDPSIPSREYPQRSSMGYSRSFLSVDCPPHSIKNNYHHLTPCLRMICLNMYAAPSTNTSGFRVCGGRRTMAARTTMPTWRSCWSRLSRAAAEASASARHHGVVFLLCAPFSSSSSLLRLRLGACSSSLE